MPRRVEDIIVTDRRSIREIPSKKAVDPKPLPRSVSGAESEQMGSDFRPTETRKPSSRANPAEVKINKIKIVPPHPPVYSKSRSNARMGRGVWLVSVAIIVLIVVVSAYVASVYFSRATFNIVPLTVPIDVSNVTIVANGTSSPGYLRYEVKKFTLTSSNTVPASDGQFISTKSLGNVYVYNSYSAQSQRLIAGTRLVGPSGRIYRLTGSVVIPGYKKSSSGVITPGSIKVDITADQPGMEYDISMNDYDDRLVVLLYKDTPRYDTIYAKLRTDVTGGFLGKKKTVDAKLLATTSSQMKLTMSKSLKQMADLAVPEGYVTFDNAYTVSFSSPVISGQSANSADVTMTANLYLIIFKQTDLVNKLARSDETARFGNSPYRADGFDSMQFTITNSANFSPQKSNALIAKVNGRITLSGIVPEAEIRSKMAGLPLLDTKAVLSSYSTVIDISKTTGELFPSWASTVPKDQNRIKVVIDNQ